MSGNWFPPQVGDVWLNNLKQSVTIEAVTETDGKRRWLGKSESWDDSGRCYSGKISNGDLLLLKSRVSKSDHDEEPQAGAPMSRVAEMQLILKMLQEGTWASMPQFLVDMSVRHGIEEVERSLNKFLMTDDRCDGFDLSLCSIEVRQYQLLILFRQENQALREKVAALEGAFAELKTKVDNMNGKMSIKEVLNGV